MSQEAPQPPRATFAALRATHTSHRLVNDILYHSTPELEALKTKRPPPFAARLIEYAGTVVYVTGRVLIPRAKIGEWIMLSVFCALAAVMIAAFIAAA